MIDLVILCPLKVEYDVVRAYLQTKSAHRLPQTGLSYELGTLYMGEKTWSIALFETGKYTDNLKLKTFQILQAINPPYIFLVGIAGGIKDVAIGDVVIGTIAYGYEYGKATQNGIESRPKAMPYSSILIDEARQLEREIDHLPYKIVFGPINSGNKVVTSSKTETYQIIKEKFGDTVGIEMESIGFAQAATAFTKTLFLNIRGISDLINHKNDNNQVEAVTHAADFVFQLIKRLQKPKNKKIKTFQIYYLTKPFTSFGWRKLNSGALQISNTLFAINIKGQAIKISQIEELEHIKMPGDLAKNWIKLVLLDGQIFYISLKTMLPGWNNIFGGSQKLLAELQPFTANT